MVCRCNWLIKNKKILLQAVSLKYNISDVCRHWDTELRQEQGGGELLTLRGSSTPNRRL